MEDATPPPSGSLIAKVGNIDTSGLTHFETIDELRRSQRPLRLDTLSRTRSFLMETSFVTATALRWEFTDYRPRLRMLPSPVLWSHLDFPRQHQLRGVITRALHDVGGPCPGWSSCASGA